MKIIDKREAKTKQKKKQTKKKKEQGGQESKIREGDSKIKEALHINWIKPNLDTQQKHLALTLSL